MNRGYFIKLGEKILNIVYRVIAPTRKRDQYCDPFTRKLIDNLYRPEWCAFHGINYTDPDIKKAYEETLKEWRDMERQRYDFPTIYGKKEKGDVGYRGE